MGAPKKRTAVHATGARSARVHVKSDREKVHIEHKQRQLRALAAALRGPHTVPEKVDVDSLFPQLRELAFAPHGFVSGDLRKLLWPLLLGDADFKPVAKGSAAHYTRRNAPHRDDEQIQKDIDRSLWHYDAVVDIRESERRVKRRQLTQVINAVLSSSDGLYYYQGYHDVCSVFLLVLGDQLAWRAVDRVSQTYQREPMRSNFEIVLHATRLLYPLLASEDPELFAHMQASGVEPFFALPWMITWFAHELTRLSDVARLFDVLLVSHPLFILYLSAAVVIEARHRVLNAECDFGTLHGLLAKLPQTMEIERVIARAAVIFHRYPPVDLLATSEHRTELCSSMYSTFPFDFHERFRSIDRPFLSPTQYKKREHPSAASSMSHKPSGWQSSVVVRAAVVGVVTMSLSFVFRHQLHDWWLVFSTATE